VYAARSVPLPGPEFQRVMLSVLVVGALPSSVPSAAATGAASVVIEDPACGKPICTRVPVTSMPKARPSTCGVCTSRPSVAKACTGRPLEVK
jgi:hypothetical protein